MLYLDKLGYTKLYYAKIGKNTCYLWVQILLKCTKILSQHHPFLYFLPNLFLPCKNTFMDDYDGI
jgi:hypothetical protein